MLTFELPDHGGNIPWAEKTFGIASEDWVDLSTGISPWVYPIADVPEKVWRQLPYSNRKLLLAAAKYFACLPANLCAVPGTQYAIENIPSFYSPRGVAIPFWGYSEHHRAWAKHACGVQAYHSFEHLLQLLTNEDLPYVVIVRPNNPSAVFFSVQQVERVESVLRSKYADDYLLVIDEAFIDLFTNSSYVNTSTHENTIILRSIGKFFGLGGLRLGFVVASTKLVQRFTGVLGQWAINSLALFVGERALQDKRWIQHQRLRIIQQSDSLNQFLKGQSLHLELHAAGLFTTVFGEPEKFIKIFTRLANAGVLVRYFPGESSMAALRFGLPGELEQQCFQRMEGLFDV